MNISVNKTSIKDVKIIKPELLEDQRRRQILFRGVEVVGFAQRLGEVVEEVDLDAPARLGPCDAAGDCANRCVELVDVEAATQANILQGALLDGGFALGGELGVLFE